MDFRPTRNRVGSPAGPLYGALETEDALARLFSYSAPFSESSQYLCIEMIIHKTKKNRSKKDAILWLYF